MTAPADARAALVRVVRDEGTRVLATLVRTTGDLSLAEDCVQDAVERALQRWPTDGVPDEPRAWLTVVARRRAVDIIRRESGRSTREATAVELDQPGDPPDVGAVRDDLLRLVFTCCHPALSTEAQVALSLRILCGLTTAEVGRALLVPEATMQKRLARAKAKIATAGIPYRVPADHDLPARVDGVVTTAYLLFNEGYAATAGDEPQRRELVAEAVRLARLLHELMPDEVPVTGLLALMLLHDARSVARHDPDGRIVLLADQDRARWDNVLVREGVLLLGDGLRRSPEHPDRFVVQAAIAACHDLAPTYETTDWAAVVSWYDVLLTVSDTPVVRLNRAAALAERDGPAVGLVEMDALESLQGYPLWHGSRAELLRRLGRTSKAREAYDAALALDLSQAQRRHLDERRASLDQGRATGRRWPP